MVIKRIEGLVMGVIARNGNWYWNGDAVGSKIGFGSSRNRADNLLGLGHPR